VEPDHGLVEGPPAVGVRAPALVPLRAHEGAGAEEPVGLNGVAAGPEDQVAAEGEVGAGVVAAVGAHVAAPEGEELVAVVRGRRRFEHLDVPGALYAAGIEGHVGLIVAGREGRDHRAGDVAGVDRLELGLAVAHLLGGVGESLAREGEVAGRLRRAVHLDGAAPPLGPGEPVGVDEDVDAGARGADLGVGVQVANDALGVSGEATVLGIADAVEVDAVEAIGEDDTEAARVDGPGADGGLLEGEPVGGVGGVDGMAGEATGDLGRAPVALAGAPEDPLVAFAERRRRIGKEAA